MPAYPLLGSMAYTAFPSRCTPARGSHFHIHFFAAHKISTTTPSAAAAAAPTEEGGIATRGEGGDWRGNFFWKSELEKRMVKTSSAPLFLLLN